MGYGLVALILLVLLAPLIALVVLSFWTQQGFAIDKTPTLANYWSLIQPSDKATVYFGIPFYLKNPVPAILLLKSLVMSLVVTITVLVVAYPMAYFLAFRVDRYKVLWLILITIPFWTSYLLRVFAWKIVLGFNGAINSGLISLGVIDKPLDFLLYNPVAVVITLIHAWVTFAILPIYVSLEKVDRNLLEAASDLGDGRWARFCRITLPLSLPGVISAALLVFIPTVGDYVTPTLVGGPGGTMIGNAIQTLFFKQDNAPLGAAVSIVMMLVIAILCGLFLWAVGYKRLRERSAA
ncbi:ABC transporter permease [Rhizobiaceae bacterium n13]|uniref:ABC transporter permease n=1 Tax=Ferirhizobium litorale TaxID=2927786 RepID=A0AAE3QHB6_9HYPH|nr:ABC transporter permease [Fererhizobium litorale]MDI7863128.1 ABC transporter permease [Fererhizobium litorale]MDI7923194.1 ABC transporter permease [Fererhizobium litorale]